MGSMVRSQEYCRGAKSSVPLKGTTKIKVEPKMTFKEESLRLRLIGPCVQAARAYPRDKEAGPSKEWHWTPRSRACTQQNQAHPATTLILAADPIRKELCNATKASDCLAHHKCRCRFARLAYSHKIGSEPQCSTSTQRQSQKSASSLLFCTRGS